MGELVTITLKRSHLNLLYGLLRIQMAGTRRTLMRLNRKNEAGTLNDAERITLRKLENNFELYQTVNDILVDIRKETESNW